MKTKEIRDLIEFIAGTGLNEVNIETEELKISVKRQPDVTTNVVDTGLPSAPLKTQVASYEVAPASAQNSLNDEPVDSPSQENRHANSANLVEIKSPMIGTFYRAANPESEPFVSIGDTVSTGQTVCIVEAMKLFNEIESEINGKIVEFLVEDATPVEYDQPLFLVDQS